MQYFDSHGMQPTDEQKDAISTFSHFLYSRQPYTTMILRGCAGTGKTTLASGFVSALKALSQNTCLLAPTGRAAKVFSLYSGQQAFTIHRRIYKQTSLDSDQPAFTLNFNKSRYTLFIIDESSMIASGQLLDDLIQYVYEQGRQCRILFMGDQAQLPPVGETESPALSPASLQDYGLEVFEANLTQVLRQAATSGILANATNIRMGSIPVHLNYPDIHLVNGNDLIESLSQSYSIAGKDNTIVITRSNKRANIYNEGIRRMILDCDDRLSSGDMLMIVKNNYFWLPAPEENEQSATELSSFIANGDVAILRRYRNCHEMYGFTFADATIQFPDYDNYELEVRILLDTLTSEAPALTAEQSDRLFHAVLDDYNLQPNRPATQREVMAQVRQDKYYNALQVKFAYAVTCHKSQGGQWSHVYIDQGYVAPDMLTEEYIHWLYTAFTRATDHLFLVNWPKEQIAAQ